MRPLRYLHALRALLIFSTCALLAPAASAFSIFELDADHSLKWGSNENGTPGGTVRWSFIPTGTAGSAYCGNACPGAALGSINIENAPGAG